MYHAIVLRTLVRPLRTFVPFQLEKCLAYAEIASPIPYTLSDPRTHAPNLHNLITPEEKQAPVFLLPSRWT